MAVTVPPGALFVASATEGIYFAVDDERWQRLPATDRRWFSNEQTAREAGYRSAPGRLEGLDEFELLQEIGRGATATVYRARDRVLDREVAIKVVHRTHHDEEETLARSFREARVVARLSHPGIVSVHSVRRLPSGGLALVMEYVPGQTLRDLIRDEGALPIERVESILREVGAALGAAHQAGIVHRDVKPHNIFLHEAAGRPLLADFGIAIPLGEATRITHAGAVIGTPAYMSPEQFDGEVVDARSDVYSLGLVAWEMLTGSSPWEGESLFNIVYKQKTAPVPSLRGMRRDVPPRLRIAIEKALQKDPRDRWTSVEEFLACLEGRSSGALWRIAALWPFPVRRRSRLPHLSAAGEPTGTDAPTVRYLPGEMPEGRASVQPVASPARRSSRRWRTAAVVLLAIGAIAAAGAGLRMQLRANEPGSGTQATYVPAAASTAGAAGAAAPGSTQPLSAPAADTLETLAVAEDSTTTVPEMLGSDSAGSAPVGAEAVGETVPANGEEPASVEVEEPAVAREAPAPPPAPSLPVDDRPSLLAAGGLHSCAIVAGSAVSCWGGNERGQIGRGSGQRQAVPLTFQLDAAPYAIAAGGFHSCLLDRTGAVYCWGDNSHGQLGGGSSLDAGPVRVPEVRFFSLAAGLSHTCGIGRDGATYCWGSNAQNQLGDGTWQDRPRPSRVGTSELLVSVTAGWTHTCALGSSGRAFCWGDNSRGQLGDGSTIQRSAPTPVYGELRFRAISAGSAHTCALTSGGEVFCWGQNGDGRLGDGTTSDRMAPTNVVGDQRFAQISAGGRHTCALTPAGAAYCWGQNGYGQLGDGGSTSHNRPVAVRTDLRFATIRSGGSHTCGTATNGDRYCWGFNLEGQVGDGTLAHRSTPAAVRSGNSAD